MSERIAGAPLSPQQRHLWDVAREGGTAPGVTRCTFEIDGRVDEGRFAASLAALARRWEILRTTFASLPGMRYPLQVVHAEPGVHFVFRDLSDAPPAERDAAAHEAQRSLSAADFDLSRGPVLRALLVKLGATRGWACLEIPTLCSDRRSGLELVRALASTYADTPPTSAPLQYADLAQWQNALIEEDDNPATAYLTELAARAPAARPLPFARPASESARALRWLEVSLPSARGGEAFWLAAWQLVLARLVDAAVVIGVRRAGRAYDGLDEALGYLEKVVPVLGAPSAEQGGHDFIRQLGRTLEEVGDIEEYFPAPPPQTTALGFAWHGAPQPNPAGDARFTRTEVTCSSTPFQLELVCQEHAGEVTARLWYDAVALDEKDVRRLGEELSTVAAHLDEDPACPIGALRAVGPEELRQLGELHGRAAPVPQGSAHARVVEQLACAKDRSAITLGRVTLTYGELDAWAGHVTARLRAMRLPRGAVVAVHMPRCLAHPAALLGVLDAGCAYLPVDPGLPPERQRLMLSDAEARVVITVEPHAADVADPSIERLILSAEGPRADERGAPSPERARAAPDDVMAVIYTSGSTGRPKGVAITHRGVANTLASLARRVPLSPDDVVLQATSLAFDVSLREILLSLSAGAHLVLVPPAAQADAAALVELVMAHRATHLRVVPALLPQFLDEAAAAGCTSLRCVFTGGEAVPMALVRRLQRQLGVRVFCTYGPTETSINAALWEASAEEDAAIAPIGFPLENTSFHVLDARQRPVPIGAPGQLWIGGVGVARGYLNQPELTAACFVPDPFDPTPGARLYASGDRVRVRSNGCFEFLGREDEQVKIRGYRVELGEVRAQLLRCTGVRAAVVLARARDGETAEPTLERRLVAYVAVAEPSPSPAELRAALGTTLPEYMIPAAFVFLPELPMTANGKVDWRRLPEPQPAPRRFVEYVPARNDLEQLLVSIWESVLNTRPVGIDDDFYALGGDSIRVVQLTHQLGSAGANVRPVDVLTTLTIRRLAQRLGGAGSPGPAAPPAGERAAPVADEREPFPVSGMQAIVLHRYAEDATRRGVYHVQQTLRLRDPSLSVPILARAVSLAAVRHPAFRTSFLRSATGEWVQVARPDLRLDPQVEDLSDRPVDEQDRVVEEALAADRRRPFDLDAGEPLLRFMLFTRSATEVEVARSAHHAITDGWSKALLFSEIVDTYVQLKRGLTPPLAAAPEVYREFVALERRVRADATSSAFWAEQVAQCVGAARAPRLAVAGADSSLRGTLPAAVAERLAELGRRMHVAVKAFYLSAFLDLVAGWRGDREATVGVVSNGRSELLSDPLRACGLFWNIVPFSCELQARKTAQAQAVQRRLVSMVPHTSFPLSAMHELAGADELFDATFNYVNFHNLSRRFGGGSDGIEVTLGRMFDKFHYPLNVVIAVHPFSGEVVWRLEADGSYVSEGEARALAERYVAAVTELSRQTEVAVA